MKPSILTVRTTPATMLCGSQDVKSDNGINYGGIDEEGSKDPASRQKTQDIWEDEEEGY